MVSVRPLGGAPARLPHLLLPCLSAEPSPHTPGRPLCSGTPRWASSPDYPKTASGRCCNTCQHPHWSPSKRQECWRDARRTRSQKNECSPDAVRWRPQTDSGAPIGMLVLVVMRAAPGLRPEPRSLQSVVACAPLACRTPALVIKGRTHAVAACGGCACHGDAAVPRRRLAFLAVVRRPRVRLLVVCPAASQPAPRPSRASQSPFLALPHLSLSRLRPWLPLAPRLPMLPLFTRPSLARSSRRCRYRSWLERLHIEEAAGVGFDRSVSEDAGFQFTFKRDAATGARGGGAGRRGGRRRAAPLARAAFALPRFPCYASSL